jgi:hypothetical protein
VLKILTLSELIILLDSSSAGSFDRCENTSESLDHDRAKTVTYGRMREDGKIGGIGIRHGFVFEYSKSGGDGYSSTLHVLILYRDYCVILRSSCCACPRSELFIVNSKSGTDPDLECFSFHRKIR